MSGRSWEKAGGLGQSLSRLAGVMSPTARRVGLWPGGVRGSPVSLVWFWGWAGVEMRSHAWPLSATPASVGITSVCLPQTSTCPGVWSVLGVTGPGGPLQATGGGIAKMGSSGAQREDGQAWDGSLHCGEGVRPEQSLE